MPQPLLQLMTMADTIGFYNHRKKNAIKKFKQVFDLYGGCNMKKILFLLPGLLLVSGCAATLTPNGDVYTELFVPTSTVIVEERPAPVVVHHHPRSVFVPAPRPFNAPRYAKRSDPRGGHAPQKYPGRPLR